MTPASAATTINAKAASVDDSGAALIRVLSQHFASPDPKAERHQRSVTVIVAFLVTYLGVQDAALTALNVDASSSSSVGDQQTFRLIASLSRSLPAASVSALAWFMDEATLAWGTFDGNVSPGASGLWFEL